MRVVWYLICINFLPQLASFARFFVTFQLQLVFFFDTMFRITMTEVECFDPLSHAWSECDHLPESRSEAGAVII